MRADPSVFQLPVEKLRSGHYTDQYFNYTKAIFDEDYPSPNVVMQVFQKKDAVLSGIDEAIAILKECSGQADFKASEDYLKEYPQDECFGGPYGSMFWDLGWDDLTVHALNEGDRIRPHEPVMYIEGPYNLFAHLETVYLGTLARRTMIATNVTNVVEAANGKPIWYFPARHDHWAVQTGDGYAAHKAGVAGVSADAQANWWGGKGMGTVPHALIAACNGSTVTAALRFADKFGADTNVSVLVDYDNSCADTAVAVADAMKQQGHELWGVRLDTSESLVDFGLVGNMGQFKPTGVNPELVKQVRARLDAFGHEDVKIIVSGGFNEAKIREFERLRLPVDAYGVGASLIHGDYAFTADIVRVNGKPQSKVGRELIDNPRAELVD
jgi:nicotinate phosphoribosyltransferase